MLAPFGLQKSIKNQGRKKDEFWRIAGVGSAAEAGLREDLIITELGL